MKLTNDHMLRLAGLDAETEAVPVGIPPEMVMPLNGMNNAADLLSHQANSNKKYNETYGPLASLSEHFNFMCAHHGLYSKGRHAPHQNLSSVEKKIASHAERPDKGRQPYKGRSLKDIYRPYRQ